MNNADDESSEIATEVSDLLRVPLDEMTTRENELSGALHRLLPFSPDDARVPVAAFNSSI
ncbi:FxSxx-COOH cyclophane-containing RiPP peptide [Microbispora rosea]|uniref:FxSxx-COOH cyclophane-containing RiPP peptide n=1 Tax=Microbispora rosea TaxID=58117 RepID=UPI0037CADFB8